MLRDWPTVFNRLILLIAFSTLFGLLVGELSLVLLISISFYLLHTLYQLLRLKQWLNSATSARDTPPPEAYGVWGDIFDDIYRMQRREWQAVDHLKSIVDKAQESTAALEIAVIMINSKSNLEWWNQAAERLLGFHPRQDQGQAVTNLIREPRFLEYFQSKNYSTPLQLRSPINSKLTLEFQITMFGEGERLMLVRDITQLHKLEMMRKDFVGNVSHELRTPITVITGYLETLLDQRESIADKWIKPLEQMYQQSRRMENIIRDLLTLSSLETRSASKQQTVINLNSLLREVRNDAKQVYSDKSHVFNIDIDAEYNLKGNLNELYSAISNLVFNAAKYTPEKGEIYLHCYKVNSGLYIEVKDNGVGIEAQHIPRITERFYRVDESRSTDTGGTGLGLAIVKHVLARHGAKLDISSEPGKGSCFKCCFPLSRVISDVEQINQI